MRARIGGEATRTPDCGERFAAMVRDVHGFTPCAVLCCGYPPEGRGKAGNCTGLVAQQATKSGKHSKAESAAVPTPSHQSCSLAKLPFRMGRPGWKLSTTQYPQLRPRARWFEDKTAAGK
jgi:hypothetical protein